MAQSGSNREMKAIEDIITCAICHELFTDARSLPCQHCFCLACLKELQTTTFLKPCPICREDTVPAARELNRLPANREVNEMVGLLMKRKSAGGTVQAAQTKPVVSPPPYTPRPQPTPQPTPVPKPQPPPAPRVRQQTSRPGAEISLADLLGLTQGKSLQERRAEAAASAAAEALAELFAEALVSGTRRGTIHNGVQCDECGEQDIEGIRYKCGVCPDYDLCADCEAKPRLFVHDVKHIFIKLRKPKGRMVPAGQVLDPMGYWIGQKMYFDSNVHAAVLKADLGGVTIQTKIPISCDKCGERPIRGKRFKCGMCDDYDLCEDCEKQSPSFHPSEHVFLVIPHPSMAAVATKRLLRFNFY